MSKLDKVFSIIIVGLVLVVGVLTYSIRVLAKIQIVQSETIAIQNTELMTIQEELSTKD